jgi:hypothetical protein
MTTSISSRTLVLRAASSTTSSLLSSTSSTLLPSSSSSPNSTAAAAANAAYEKHIRNVTIISVFAFILGVFFLWVLFWFCVGIWETTSCCLAFGRKRRGFWERREVGWMAWRLGLEERLAGWWEWLFGDFWRFGGRRQPEEGC